MNVLSKLRGATLAVGSLGLLLGIPGQGTGTATSPSSPLKEITDAIAAQESYRALQQRRVCKYTRTVRSDYGTGWSLSRRDIRDEVFFNIGAEASEAAQDSAAPAVLSVSAETFDLWNHPLFQAILKMDAFSPTGQTTTWDGRTYDRFTFAFAPGRGPTNDIERVAQATTGTVSLDENTHLFVALEGYARTDLYEGKRLLVLGPRHDHEAPIPLFTYHSGPADGVIVPTLWDEAQFAPVKRGKDEAHHWLATLTRTFIRLRGCQEYRVKSTIRPGFNVVLPPADPQP